MGRPSPAREAFAILSAFGLLVAGLVAWTGLWPPAVLVESSSMMHPQEEVGYGRSWASLAPTTIDPGDVAFVKRVDGIEDVATLLEGGASHYGRPGDVIVYYPGGDRQRTPIIHRAVAYVEVSGLGASTNYRVRWDPHAPCEGGAAKDGAWCVYGREGILIPSVPVQRRGVDGGPPLPYRPAYSGFLTKGDNPVTNPIIDQVAGLSPPVDIAWVMGEARGEVPWLGLLKLSFMGRANEEDPPEEWVRFGSAYAPSDLWVMLGFALCVLIGGPLTFDVTRALRRRRLRQMQVQA